MRKTRQNRKPTKGTLINYNDQSGALKRYPEGPLDWGWTLRFLRRPTNHFLISYTIPSRLRHGQMAHLVDAFSLRKPRPAQPPENGNLDALLSGYGFPLLTWCACDFAGSGRAKLQGAVNYSELLRKTDRFSGIWVILCSWTPLGFATQNKERNKTLFRWTKIKVSFYICVSFYVCVILLKVSISSIFSFLTDQKGLCCLNWTKSQPEMGVSKTSHGAVFRSEGKDRIIVHSPWFFKF